MKLWGKEAFNPYSHRRMKIKVKKKMEWFLYPTARDIWTC